MAMGPLSGGKNGAMMNQRTNWEWRVPAVAIDPFQVVYWYISSSVLSVLLRFWKNHLARFSLIRLRCTSCQRNMYTVYIYYRLACCFDNTIVWSFLWDMVCVWHTVYMSLLSVVSSQLDCYNRTYRIHWWITLFSISWETIVISTSMSTWIRF